MWKEYKGKWIVSSLVILLPMLAGLLLWDRLPASMATHWGADGVADGFGGRFFGVVVVPLTMLVLHWLALLITAYDNKGKDQSRKAMGLLFWIMPVCSLFVCGVMYSIALGRELDMELLLPPLLGVSFLAMGNSMPKVKQNSTYGIKVVWALRSEENWNRTHRFGGKVWVVCGIAMLLAAFLPGEWAAWLMLGAVCGSAVLPVLYSYLYYRRQVREGRWESGAREPSRLHKTGGWIGTAVGVAMLVFLGGMMFTGDIDFQLGDHALFIDASYHDDLTVDYDRIDSVAFRTDCPAGSRTWGFGSPRLSMGAFENAEFGTYTRYAYTGCEACVVLRSGDRVLVLSGRDEDATRELYQALLEKVG